MADDGTVEIPIVPSEEDLLHLIDVGREAVEFLATANGASGHATNSRTYMARIYMAVVDLGFRRQRLKERMAKVL